MYELRFRILSPDSLPKTVSPVPQTAFGHCIFNPFLPFSAVNKERHFSCEDCDGNVSGGFDASTSQVGIFASCLLSSTSLLPFAEHLPHAVENSETELVMVPTLKELPLLQGRQDMNTGGRT